VRPAGAEVGRRQRDAARQPGDHRAEPPGGGEPQHRALARPDHRERQVAGAGAAAVADFAADQREHDVLALVERSERADPEGRGVVRDEQDGPAHRANL
jgi:hypothetical protein